MNAPVTRIDLRDVSTLPTRRDEAWRWSDLRRAVGEAVAPAPALEGAAGDDLFSALGGPETLIANGARADGGEGEIVLAAGVNRLRFVTRADGAGWQARLALRVPAGVEAVLLERYGGEGAYVSSVALDIVLEPGASLERVVVMDEPDSAVSVQIAEVALSPGARLGQTTVLTGARLQRAETRLVHPGEGVAVRLDGLYLLGGARHADLTSVVEHTGGGETSQMCKGVAADRARAVFQGKIAVARGADGTDARMRHDALLLSDAAEVDAKPELEIYADDVACAHGNTVGALDEDALFYIRSRGVPETAARALLMRAFVGEVVERIEHERAREAVAEFVAERLEALA